MGNFANTLFSTLLGWLRGAAAWLWNFLGQSDHDGLIVWIAENWLTLIILLCAVCMLVDFLVYLLRWQPYKVWASFFRRLTGRQDEEDDTGRIRRRWVHADGTTSVEVVDAAEVADETPLEPQAFPFQPDIDVNADPYAPYRPPEAPAGPDLMEEEPPEEITERPARSEERRRRFAGSQEELPLRYAPPPAATEEPPAYHEPYYPPQWKPPADTGASGMPAGGDGQ